MISRDINCPFCQNPIIVEFPGHPALIVLPEGFEAKHVETTKSGLLIAHKPRKTMYWSPMHKSWQVLL